MTKTDNNTIKPGRQLISVLICTYNRCHMIQDLLENLLQQRCDDLFDYEVIVADNNSKDKTREVVESYRSRFQGRLKYLFQPIQGKTYALNLGIKEARGEIIACLDDDCLVEETHLLNVYRVFQELALDVGVIGGKIFPKWIGNGYPAWLDKIFNQPANLEDGTVNWEKISLEGPLGILDFGEKPYIIDYRSANYDIRRFYGANMAFRSKFLRQYGGFKDGKVVGEDTEICERLFKAGVKGAYTPNVKVYHKIKSKNVTPGYYYRWRFTRGIHMEVDQNYQRRFYHPFGIQIAFIRKTLDLFKKSFIEKDLFKKVRYRGKAIFNLGKMIQVAKNNLI